ncbi:hypothetical protein CPB84DRAFT_1749334 [Gymnopilus junonius]|uniref:Uncharacterized protein n=1 Tax=Gymnopilus junonius TaxID=109634 RepID=A0A9P5NJQ8_GYMJU|nr:hypothetical protein CPB84DRAFT_1749334 [Gymnopilus junonius]
MLPRDTDDNLLTKLEYAWGLGYQTLNVDNSLNVLRLSSHLHYLLEKGAWILLTEDYIIKTYLPNGALGGETFKYRLIPSVCCGALPLERVVRQVEPQEPITPADIHHYFYPYADFPLLESHVHPRFVIASIGVRIHSIDRLLNFKKNGSLNAETIDTIVGCLAIFRMWRELQIPPRPSFLHPGAMESAFGAGQVIEEHEAFGDQTADAMLGEVEGSSIAEIVSGQEENEDWIIGMEACQLENC